MRRITINGQSTNNGPNLTLFALDRLRTIRLVFVFIVALEKARLLWKRLVKQSSNLASFCSYWINDDGKWLMQCRIQSIFWDTLYSCYCKLRLVNPPWWGLRGRNYFYLLKSTKSTKTTSQKCWRNIIRVDFFGRPYHTNGIKDTIPLTVGNHQFTFLIG